MGEPDSDEPTFRRRAVVIAFGMVGIGLLAWGLRAEPGSGAFYTSTLALAVVWLLGGLLSGPVTLGWEMHDGRRRRPVLSAIIAGAVLAAVFVVGALVVRHIPVLRHRVAGVLDFARHGSWPIVLALTVANGLAEEVFFRGGVQPALPERIRLPASVAIYAGVTLATGKVMLCFAAALLGVVVSLQRRATDGVLSPILTHVLWAVLMFIFLPLVIR
ncbi:MAG TPA: type II CAAX endopeptidase family protein [Ilumatobacteraceae bacterium]|nr:type II CAAX endopeptidase family protein [Ilumatobacteraceae bacterium]